MHILCVCRMGRNRSRYLATYLKSLGHETQFGGVGIWPTNPITAEQVAWADVIITARGWMRERIMRRYDTTGKSVISLGVTDSATLIGPGAMWCKLVRYSDFQERFVYCKLRSKLEPHLPLQVAKAA